MAYCGEPAQRFRYAVIQGLADSKRQERTGDCCSGRIVDLLSIPDHCLVPLSLYLSVAADLGMPKVFHPNPSCQYPDPGHDTRQDD